MSVVNDLGVERVLEEQGLRQRKKTQTRAQIVEAAIAAFLQFGYEKTTLDQIADAAGVTKRTLLRYFPSKVHLVLGGQHEAMQAFKHAIANRCERSVVDIWEEHVAVNAAWIAEHGDAKVSRSIIASEPAINTAMLGIQAEYQNLIFECLVEEFPGDGDREILLAIVAAALVGGNYQVGSLYFERGDYKSLPSAERTVIQTIRSQLLDAISGTA